MKQRELNFSNMMIGLERIDIARYFIAMLYLCMKDKIEIITGFTDLEKGIDYVDSSQHATIESLGITENFSTWIKIIPKNNQ